MTSQPTAPIQAEHVIQALRDQVADLSLNLAMWTARATELEGALAQAQAAAAVVVDDTPTPV